MKLLVDHTGKVYTNFTVLSVSHKDRHGAVYWNCLCICGKQRVIAAKNFTYALKTVNCQCDRPKRKKVVTLSDGPMEQIEPIKSYKTLRRCKKCSHKLPQSHYFLCQSCWNSSPPGSQDYDQYDWGYSYGTV
jgi:hypothetical protein